MAKVSASRKNAKQARLTFGAAGLSQSALDRHERFSPGPNAKLDAFIREHATPYDARRDAYDVKAFDRDVVIDKATPPKPIYDMHTYWSKKHWAAVREYVHHYLPPRHYPPGTGLILDCFSGSGMTGVAAMMERRPCVLVDASPAAAFISHCYSHPADKATLEAAYDKILSDEYPAELQQKLLRIAKKKIRNLTEEFEWLYETQCDRCLKNATTEYVVFSERFQCPVCADVVPLFDCPEVNVPHPKRGRGGQDEMKRQRVCPRCFERKGAAHRDFVISTRGKKFGSVPVVVRYRCLGLCKPAVDERRHDEAANTKKGRLFHAHDVAKLELIEAAELPHWYPERRMMDVEDEAKPWGVKWRSGSANFRWVEELYTRRSLWALAAVRGAISRLSNAPEALSLAVTVPAMTCSRMLREKKRNIQAGTYYIPQESRQTKVSNAIEYGRRIIISAQDTLFAIGASPCIVSNDDATQALAAHTEVMDYAFIDPPYLNVEVQYGELNFIWESWLGYTGEWLATEIAWNPIRGIEWEAAESRLRNAIAAVYRALKPGRYASICYHDTSERNWRMLQDAVLDAGFEIDSVTTLDAKQKSEKQRKGEKVVKSDLVVNCRKPKPGERGENGNGELVLVSQRVREILIEMLSHSGGQTRDRLWNRVLKRLLARGQMAEHRFNDILSSVATRSEAGRWFLKEEFESLSADDIKNEEKAGDALVRFTRLRMAGVPASFAAETVLRSPHIAQAPLDERRLQKHIRDTLVKDKIDADRFELGGRLKGIEFYDCLFFYLTRWLKDRAAGMTPRRNLAEFLDEYLVRFKEGEKWLHRAPDDAETETLRKARKTGLGRRIRQYAAFVQGDGEYPRDRIPDGKTLVAWLKHCAAFGLPEEGVVLFEKGGVVLSDLNEEERYDAEDYYAQCRRRLGKSDEGADDEPIDEEGEE